MTLLRSPGSLAAVLLSFVLWGCAGPQVSKEATPEAIQGRGVVIVSVTHDADTGRRSKAHFFIDQQSKQFETRVVRSVEEVLMITKGSDFDDVHGRVYVLDVEPGMHSVDAWQSAGQAVRIAPRSAPRPLGFEVKAGEVVYIGNLNLNHSFGRNLLGISVVASAQPEVRDRRDLDLSIAEAKVPSIKGRVQVRLLPLGPWNDQATSTERRIEAVPPTLLVPPKQP
jgi:hypothetical protein